MAKNVKTLENYKLGDSIGKGGFGTVYKAINMHTGNTVAIKQVSIINVPKKDLESIMMEIDMLKALQHENIVKYIGFIKTKEHLNIILEFVENGSLASTIKKFGSFPESLVAIYIAQVLEGLVFLHDQGVIHRDIKGANILTTKEGHVKLADFGVATRLGEVEKSLDVVGSPYWMAPEIIELQAPSSASDVWSVGATIIELLTGAPPYFELAAMPAMFRIVQDDCPPIPDLISPELREFCTLCFKKNPLERATAKTLLHHNWIRVAVQSRQESEGVAEPNLVTTPWTEIVTRTLELHKSASQTGGIFFRSAKNKTKPSSSSKKAGEATTRGERPSLDGLANYAEDDDENWDDAFEDQTEMEDDETIDGPPAALVSKLAPDSGVMEGDHIVEIWESDDDFEDGVKEDIVPAGPPPAHAIISADPRLDRFRDGNEDDMNDWNVNFSPEQLNKVKRPEVIRPNDLRLPQAPVSRLSDFVEKEGDDALLDFDIDLGGDFDTDAPNFASKLKRKMELGEDAMDDDVSFDDPFAGMTMTFAQSELLNATNVEDRRRQEQEMARHVQIIQQAGAQPSSEVFTACRALEKLLKEHAELRTNVVSLRLVLPLVELLQRTADDETRMRVLNLMNVAAEDCVPVLESMCVMGVLPTMMQLFGPSHPRKVRRQVAYFLRNVCHASPLTLQMLVAAQGLSTLVAMIEDDYQTSRDFLFIAIDCIVRVIRLEGPTSKRDFCRLFCSCKLLPRLVTALTKLRTDQDAAAQPFVEKVVNLLLLFSLGDDVVKASMAQASVLKPLLSVLGHSQPQLPAPILVRVLRCVKNLSMDANTHNSLFHAGALRLLIPFLGFAEMSGQALTALYFLCKIQKSFQEEAAAGGIVASLLPLLDSPSHRQLALAIFCNLAHASRKTVQYLAKHDCVAQYLRLLHDSYWKTHALESLAAWLAFTNDVTIPIVERQMTTPAAIESLIDAFAQADLAHIEKITTPISKILAHSPAIDLALGSSRFVRELLVRLEHPEAVVRVRLMQILATLFDHHRQPKVMVAQNSLKEAVAELIRKDKAVLVTQLAEKLLLSFNALEAV